MDNVIEVSVVQEMECYRRYLGDNVYANFDGQKILALARERMRQQCCD